MALSEQGDRRAHVLIYNSTFISPDALKSLLTAAPAVSNWVDVGLINVMFVQTWLTTKELVAVVNERYRHPNSHVVAIEVEKSWWGQAPKALWDMLDETETTARQLALHSALAAGQPDSVPRT